MKSIVTAKSNDYDEDKVMGYVIINIIDGVPKAYNKGSLFDRWCDLDSGNCTIYNTKDNAKEDLNKLLNDENKLLFIVACGR